MTSTTIQTPAARRQLSRLALAALPFAAACGGSANAEPARQAASPGVVTLAPREYATVEARTIQSGPVLSGTLVPRVRAVVRAELAGTVAAVLADRGARVAAGAPLARLSDHVPRAMLASAAVEERSARSALDAAERRATRLERLLAAGAVSAEEAEDARQAVDDVRSRLEAARTQRVAAEEELAHATVRAPFGGIVSVRSVSAGELVQPGTPMFEVLDPSTMRLEASLPSSQLAALTVGARVEFSVAAYPGRTFLGRVEHVSPAADAGTRQVPVTVAIANRDGRLVAGLFAEGRLTVDARRATLAPAAAVELERGAEGRGTVLRLNAGRVSRATVEARDAGIAELVEIVSGLSVGDTVLVGAVRTRTAPGARARIDTLSVAYAAATAQ